MPYGISEVSGTLWNEMVRAFHGAYLPKRGADKEGRW